MLRLYTTHGLIIVLTISSIRCDSLGEPDPLSFLFLQDVPVITGIHVTTVNNPEGNGEVIGTPSYAVSSNSVNVFPNPYVEPDTIRRFEYFPFELTFSHLPEKATIVIVRGRWQGEPQTVHPSYGGATVRANEPWVVTTLQKSGPGQYLRWPLTDDKRHFVPTGVYRAFYYGDGIDGVKFIDISVKRGRARLIDF